jgi:hypothetical protein
MIATYLKVIIRLELSERDTLIERSPNFPKTLNEIQGWNGGYFEVYWPRCSPRRGLVDEGYEDAPYQMSLEIPEWVDG